MKKDILFTLPSYFRDDMNITAYRFGKGEKTCAVVGALRGDEVQQLYVCARLVSFLREAEKEDGIQPGKSVMIVPTAIGASMNEGSRLWEPENMDINRRFPGDPTGSTTERITDALLERVKNYRYGVQLTSFYQPGSFVPHVRMMDTGRQNPRFGLRIRPALCLRPHPARLRPDDPQLQLAALRHAGIFPLCGQDTRNRRGRGGSEPARHRSASSTAAGSSAAKPRRVTPPPSSPTRI